MKNLKIQVPEGYEIDKEKSTFENIILKKIEKKQPLSVRDIKGKHWYEALGDVTSEGRANAFLALMQLVELRDAWNEASDAEWASSGIKSVIHVHKGEVKRDYFWDTQFVLYFKTPELRDQFLAQFRNLIETAKELI